MDRFGKEQLLQMILHGTSPRIIDTVAGLSPADAQDLVELRDGLTDVTLGEVAPVVPRATLRERLLASKPRVRRPVRPVMLVLDMIQDHLTPGKPMEVPRARAIVPALQHRLDAARSKDIPVIYVCDTHSLDDPDFHDWPVHAVEGTAGADPWPELAPHKRDHLIRKRTYSAFTGSDLGSLLDDLSADEIILTGCLTEIGVSATAHDALQRGFVVTIPPDAQAGASEIAEQVTLISLALMPPFEPRYLRKR
ncbi:MAG: cysteine hydrolase [Polyangiaceae bacterium]|nr:cysteine hydrolase [Polyangiaceae bacterium]